MTWKDHYEADCEEINGITVRRFSVDKPRNQAKFDKINAKMLRRKFHEDGDEELWVDEQGPVCTKLVNYIKENKVLKQKISQYKTKAMKIDYSVFEEQMNNQTDSFNLIIADYNNQAKECLIEYSDDFFNIF